MADLEKGRSRMMKGLPGINPPDRMLVIVNRNSNDTRALTKDLRTLSALVAIAEAQVSTEGAAEKVTRVGGQRVFVLWRSYGNRPGERRQVIAHELVHVALAKRAGGRIPVWLSEGIAMYASGDKRAGDAGALLSGARLKDSSKQAASEKALSLTKLAQPDAFDRMSAIPLSFAYSYASAAAYAIASNHGGGKALLRLYASFNSEKHKGRPGAKLSNKVFKKVLKKSLRRRSRRRSTPTPGPTPVQVASLLGRHARASRSRDDPRSSGASRRGAGAGDRGGPRRALVSAAGARRARSGGAGPARRAARPARQVPRVGALRRRVPAHAPAHDGHVAAGPGPPTRYMRVRLGLGDHELVFDDPRRFGTGELALGPEAFDAFFDARLGVEPLERDFTGDHLYALAKTPARRLRRSCSTRSASRASGTSTPTRRYSAPASTRCGPRTSSRGRSARRCATRSWSR